jgi:general secretion pathway protein H
MSLDMDSSTLKLRGFTLLELMVVMTIVAVSIALVTLALPSGNARTLAREADRLAALLDAARAQSRASGVPVTWQPQNNGFVFNGLPSPVTRDGSPWPTQWLNATTQADLLTPAGQALLLGPDPVIGAQAVEIFQSGQNSPRMRVSTDGLHPFTVENAS